jgi:hypothetical protein
MSGSLELVIRPGCRPAAEVEGVVAGTGTGLLPAHQHRGPARQNERASSRAISSVGEGQVGARKVVRTSLRSVPEPTEGSPLEGNVGRVQGDHHAPGGGENLPGGLGERAQEEMEAFGAGVVGRGAPAAAPRRCRRGACTPNDQPSAPAASPPAGRPPVGEGQWPVVADEARSICANLQPRPDSCCAAAGRGPCGSMPAGPGQPSRQRRSRACGHYL